MRIPISELEPLDHAAPTDSENEAQDREEEKRSTHLAPPGHGTTDSSHAKKPTWIRRLSDSITGKKYSEHHRETVRVVQMTREEYEMYWARDEAGKYIGTEPEGSGREWYARKLEGYKEGKREWKDQGVMNGVMALAGGTHA